MREILRRMMTTAYVIACLTVIAYICFLIFWEWFLRWTGH